jgi:hypothetical protein
LDFREPELTDRMKQVICIKWGTMYGPEYVNVMYGMCRRNITGDFTLICLTDNPEGIREEVKCLPLPLLNCEIPPDVPGKWPKIAMWGRELFGLSGHALFIDLDSVIVGNIDDFFTYGEPDQVYVARNWVRFFGKHGQTSVFRFKIGGNPYMLEDLQANSAEISRKYQFEQNYVTAHLKGGIEFWPEGWIKHFGIHCMGIWPLRYLRPPVLPKGVKIVTFPGRPKPPDSIAGRWNKSSEARTPMEQLRWVFAQRKTDKRWRRQFSRYLMPTDWIAEHWRE